MDPKMRHDEARGRRGKGREAGFTLLELLVVLGILGLIIGLVGPAVMRQFGAARHTVAAQSIARLGSVLEIYRLDVGTYPTTQQGLSALTTRPQGVEQWNGSYATGDVINDPWGNPFQYRNPSQREGLDYDLISLGADNRPGGEGEDADIYNTR